jgi:hypothetical protein
MKEIGKKRMLRVKTKKNSRHDAVMSLLKKGKDDFRNLMINS